MGSSRKAIHEAAHQAKEFIIGKIVLEAELEGVSLSEIERKMLYFSEVEHEPPDLIEVNEQFEKECDSREYEAKVARLIKQAYQRDCTASKGNSGRWFDEITALSKEDHYILVMVGQARLRKPGDTIRFVVACVGIGIALAAFLIFTGDENLQGPELNFACGVFVVVLAALWIVASAPRRAVAGVIIRQLLPRMPSERSRNRNDGSQTKTE
jgi:hypothetical protein